MLIDPTEVERSENNGLQGIVTALQPYAAKYGVSNADVLHVAGALSVVLCPGGPQVTPFFVGRVDATEVNPTGHLPDPTDSVDVLIARFLDMGLNTDELVSLIGAHSTATQQFVDSAYAFAPLDTTPNTWDTSFCRPPFAPCLLREFLCPNAPVLHRPRDHHGKQRHDHRILLRRQR